MMDVLDLSSLAGMVLRCKERQPGRFPLLQGELSVLARITGEAVHSAEAAFFCNRVLFVFFILNYTACPEKKICLL